MEFVCGCQGEGFDWCCCSPGHPPQPRTISYDQCLIAQDLFVVVPLGKTPSDSRFVDPFVRFVGVGVGLHGGLVVVHRGFDSMQSAAVHEVSEILQQETGQRLAAMQETLQQQLNKAEQALSARICAVRGPAEEVFSESLQRLERRCAALDTAVLHLQQVTSQTSPRAEDRGPSAAPGHKGRAGDAGGADGPSSNQLLQPQRLCAGDDLWAECAGGAEGVGWCAGEGEAGRKEEVITPRQNDAEPTGEVAGERQHRGQPAGRGAPQAEGACHAEPTVDRDEWRVLEDDCVTQDSNEYQEGEAETEAVGEAETEVEAEAAAGADTQPQLSGMPERQTGVAGHGQDCGGLEMGFTFRLDQRDRDLGRRANAAAGDSSAGDGTAPVPRQQAQAPGHHHQPGLQDSPAASDVEGPVVWSDHAPPSFSPHPWTAFEVESQGRWVGETDCVQGDGIRGGGSDADADAEDEAICEEARRAFVEWPTEEDEHRMTAVGEVVGQALGQALHQKEGSVQNEARSDGGSEAEMEKGRAKAGAGVSDSQSDTDTASAISRKREIEADVAAAVDVTRAEGISQERHSPRIEVTSPTSVAGDTVGTGQWPRTPVADPEDDSISLTLPATDRPVPAPAAALEDETMSLTLPPTDMPNPAPVAAPDDDSTSLTLPSTDRPHPAPAVALEEDTTSLTLPTSDSTQPQHTPRTPPLLDTSPVPQPRRSVGAGGRAGAPEAPPSRMPAGRRYSSDTTTGDFDTQAVRDTISEDISDVSDDDFSDFSDDDDGPARRRDSATLSAAESGPPSKAVPLSSSKPQASGHGHTPLPPLHAPSLPSPPHTSSPRVGAYAPHTGPHPRPGHTPSPVSLALPFTPPSPVRHEPHQSPIPTLDSDREPPSPSGSTLTPSSERTPRSHCRADPDPEFDPVANLLGPSPNVTLNPDPHLATAGVASPEPSCKSYSDPKGSPISKPASHASSTNPEPAVVAPDVGNDSESSVRSSSSNCSEGKAPAMLKDRIAQVRAGIPHSEGRRDEAAAAQGDASDSEDLFTSNDSSMQGKPPAQAVSSMPQVRSQQRSQSQLQQIKAAMQNIRGPADDDPARPVDTSDSESLSSSSDSIKGKANAPAQAVSSMPQVRSQQRTQSQLQQIKAAMQNIRGPVDDACAPPVDTSDSENLFSSSDSSRGKAKAHGVSSQQQSAAAVSQPTGRRDAANVAPVDTSDSENLFSSSDSGEDDAQPAVSKAPTSQFHSRLEQIRAGMQRPKEQVEHPHAAERPFKRSDSATSESSSASSSSRHHKKPDVTGGRLSSSGPIPKRDRNRTSTEYGRDADDTESTASLSFDSD